MKVLLIGGGGRTYVFAWKLDERILCEQLFIAPVNAGTASLGTNLNIDFMDFDAVKESVLREKINFVIIGPEAPLVAGIVDFFRDDPALRSIPVLGPDHQAALLEGSKSFAKSFMMLHHILRPRYLAVQHDNLEEGYQFLKHTAAVIISKPHIHPS